MAHGESLRPLETTDGKPVDRETTLGNSSLYTQDARVAELLEQILEEQRKIRLALEILINEEV